MISDSGNTILLLLVVVFLASLVLWCMTAVYGSTKWRLMGGVPILVAAISTSSLISTAVTQLNDQSYYAASITILIDETIESLESQDSSFLDRLRKFSEQQPITYESRADLLQNLRKFRSDGDATRKAKSLSTDED
jgi:cell division protein FtsX